MWPFTESRCDICDLGMWICIAVILWLLWYWNRTYEIRERKKPRKRG